MDLAFQQPFDASMSGPITASSGMTTCGTITVEEADDGGTDGPSDPGDSPIPEVPTTAVAGGVALVILLVVFLLMN